MEQVAQLADLVAKALEAIQLVYSLSTKIRLTFFKKDLTFGPVGRCC